MIFTSHEPKDARPNLRTFVFRPVTNDEPDLLPQITLNSTSSQHIAHRGYRRNNLRTCFRTQQVQFCCCPRASSPLSTYHIITYYVPAQWAATQKPCP